MKDSGESNGQVLTGRRCQCAACGEYFNSLSVFEDHRYGSYAKKRKCMTPDEMKEKGLVYKDGFWMVPLSEERIEYFRRINENKRG